MNSKFQSLHSKFLKPRTRYARMLVILGMAGMSSVAAHAQLLNIATTENTNGTAPNSGAVMAGSAVLGTTPGNSTDYWNTLNLRDVHSFTDLHDANNVATTVSLVTTGFQGVNGGSGLSDGGFVPAIFDNFAFEFLANGATSTMDFSGLTPGDSYTLVFYGLNGSDGADGTYSINGGSADTLVEAGSTAYTSTLSSNPSDPGSVYSGNYISLTGVADPVTGDLDISLSIAPTNTSNNGPQPFSYMAFTGLQIEGNIQTIPEPSAMGLTMAGLGVLALLAYRRRAMASRL